MSSNNEETLKKWANVLQSNNLTQLCPILTAEENIQQTGENNVPVPPLKANIFQLPVPWRKKDDVHPYKASVQPIAPITFTSNQNFPKPTPLIPSGGKRSECPCTCKTISSPMGQTQKYSVSAHPLGTTSSIKPTSQCLTKPMLWKDDEDEPICSCPKVPLPLIQPDPKRPFVKCECNELMRNVAPTNYKCSKPKQEVKMTAFLDKDKVTKSEAPTARPDQSSFSKPQKSGEDKGEVCCCCEDGTKKDGKDKTEKQEESDKEKVKNKNGENNKKDGSGSDDKKTIKKHGKDEVEKRKKMENNGNKDKKTEKGSPKEENKEISIEKEKMENKKKQNGSSKKPNSIKSVSSTPSSDYKTESSKSKAKNGKKIAADKKDPSNEQASPDTSPSIDESKTSKKKDKKSKKEMDVKKETKEKRAKESDCLKKINELTSKLPPDFVADFAQGMYPGMKVGHATCCLPSIRIPCKMGWLWNSCEGAGHIKPDLGWRPGAIRASTFSAMKAGRKLVKQNKQYEEEEIMSDEKMKGDGDQGRKDDLDDEDDDSDLEDDDDDEFEDENDGKGKRRRSKPSVMTKEEEKEDQTKPTLHLHKTKGQYFISLYTPDEKEKKKEDEGRVLMTFNRKTLELGSSASSSSSGKSSTVTEDSMELDYTTPYTLYKQAKCTADKCNRQTQYY